MLNWLSGVECIVDRIRPIEQINGAVRGAKGGRVALANPYMWDSESTLWTCAAASGRQPLHAVSYFAMLMQIDQCGQALAQVRLGKWQVGPLRDRQTTHLLLPAVPHPCA